MGCLRGGKGWLGWDCLSLLDWLRDRFRPKPSAFLEPVLAFRALYLEQVETVANVRAALDALDRQIESHRAIVRKWESRMMLPGLPEDVRAGCATVHERYSYYLANELCTRASVAATLRSSEELAESMLQDLVRLGRGAAAAGLDTRTLAVEIDVTALERAAAERNALAIIEDGGLDQDEERVFLERLFERGLSAN